MLDTYWTVYGACSGGCLIELTYGYWLCYVTSGTSEWWGATEWRWLCVWELERNEQSYSRKSVVHDDDNGSKSADGDQQGRHKDDNDVGDWQDHVGIWFQQQFDSRRIERLAGFQFRYGFFLVTGCASNTLLWRRFWSLTTVPHRNRGLLHSIKKFFFVCRTVRRSPCCYSFKDGIFGTQTVCRLRAADNLFENCVEGITRRPRRWWPWAHDAQPHGRQCFIYCDISTRLLQTWYLLLLLLLLLKMKRLEWHCARTLQGHFT